VAEIPQEPRVDLTRGRWFWLDGVRDPGNLGTILRLVDWFSLDGVVVSPDCVDSTNPKAVQASMGSLFRVPVLQRDLTELLAQTGPGLSVAGTFMDGTPLGEADLPANGALILGNEGEGIRPEVAALLRTRIGIPGGGGAESLNVAMAAAVCAYEWTQRSCR
jgi:TrmH family RNA methyltransferase